MARGRESARRSSPARRDPSPEVYAAVPSTSGAAHTSDDPQRLISKQAHACGTRTRCRAPRRARRANTTGTRRSRASRCPRRAAAIRAAARRRCRECCSITNGCSGSPVSTANASSVEVLAHAALARRRRLERARQVRRARCPRRAPRRRGVATSGSCSRARRRRDPAAVDQHVDAFAEAQRRDHFVSRRGGCAACCREDVRSDEVPRARLLMKSSAVHARSRRAARCRGRARASRSARRACQLPSAMPAAHAAAASASDQRRGRKEYPASMRYVVIAMLIAIVASLGSALFAMLKPRQDPSAWSRRCAAGRPFGDAIPDPDGRLLLRPDSRDGFRASRRR